MERQKLRTLPDDLKGYAAELINKKFPEKPMEGVVSKIDPKKVEIPIPSYNDPFDRLYRQEMVTVEIESIMGPIVTHRLVEGSGQDICAQIQPIVDRESFMRNIPVRAQIRWEFGRTKTIYDNHVSGGRRE